MYAVRPYAEGDDSSLLSLFNAYYGDYGGFVPRTLQHWVWCCKLHPDIGSDGIFIATKDAEVVGYAVVGQLSQQEGGFIIYELAYHPDHDGTDIVKGLMERANHYVQERGGNYVTFPAPADDLMIRAACDASGFTQGPLNEVIGFIALDMTKVLEQILKAKPNPWQGKDEAFLIQLSNSPSSVHLISIRLTKDDVYVTNEDPPAGNKVVIQTDFTTLNEIIFCGISVLRALFASKLAINPLWRIRTGLRFLSTLSLENRWYIPRLDQI